MLESWSTMNCVTGVGSVSEHSILIGTAGFKYEDWRGPFYPMELPKNQMLEYYAARFSLLELDFTYYQIPSPRTMEGFCERTPDGFCFCVKGHRSLTHDEEQPPDACSRFREAIEPMAKAGKLGAVLLQFPYRFRPTGKNCDRLAHLRQALGGLPVVVEFRHSDWVRTDRLARMIAWLKGLDLGFCCVDEPRLRGLMPPVVEVSSDVGYVRFHGRNADRWFDHTEAWERYNYLYSDDELQPWVSEIAAISEQAARTLVVFNNHYGGNAPKNAGMLRELLFACDPLLPAG